MTMAELEAWMTENDILQINCHFTGVRFIAHVRHKVTHGFVTGQKHHHTLEGAVREHMPASRPAGDLSDLLGD